MTTETIDNRLSIWKDFRKTTVQQFMRSNADPSKHVILLLDARDDFSVHLVKTCYRAAIKEEGANLSPEEELGILSLIGAPFVLILPLDAAVAALSRVLPNPNALTEPPPPGKVRAAIIEDGCCTVLYDWMKTPKKNLN